MNLDRGVMLIAGLMILLSLALTRWLHPGWVWMTVLIGLILIQASVTRFCPAALLLRRFGVRRGTAFR